MRTFCCSLSLLILTQCPGLAADWKLVWADEFEKPGLPDSGKWDYETGFIRNQEAQFYTQARKENARVENGHLVIEARKERMKNPAFASDSSGKKRRGAEFAEYTSASLITRGKAEWKYGRVEVRAKLPSGKGTWPAIWMLGTNITQVGWPICGEIDILEFVGYEPGVVHANVHTGTYNHSRGTGKGNRLPLPTASDSFHVYALEWSPVQLDFYVDQRRHFTFKKEKDDPGVWPFDREQYLILNLAIGGAWGGKQGIDDTIFPQQFVIDYVRVFKASDQN